MKANDTVKIISSPELIEMKLGQLCGETGIVVEARNSGCWVEFQEPFMDEMEWFVPYSSLVKTGHINDEQAV